jgi:hypothetical protein
LVDREIAFRAKRNRPSSILSQRNEYLCVLCALALHFSFHTLKRPTRETRMKEHTDETPTGANPRSQRRYFLERGRLARSYSFQERANGCEKEAGGTPALRE